MRYPGHWIIGIVTACCLAIQAQANIREFQVHESVEGDQQRVQAAQLSDGRIIFVYENQGTNGTRVYFRFLDPSLGTFSGEGFITPENPEDQQTDPVVAALADGRYVVAYTNRDTNNPPALNVILQTFRATGAAASPPINPNTSDFGNQFHPRIASLGEHGYVVAFADLRSGDQDIYVRSYSLDGDPLKKTELIANGLGTSPVLEGDQGDHDVDGLPDGGFVVVFEDRTREQIIGIQFNAESEPVPARGFNPEQFLFRVDSDVTPELRSVSAPRVSTFSGGDYVVAYNSEALDGSTSREIRARLFKDPGEGGNEFEAGQHKLRWQDPDVLALPDRSMIFAWQARGEPETSPPWSVRVYPREANGPHEVSGFIAAPNNLYSRDHVHLAALANGGFVAAWESEGQDGDGHGVYARMVAPLEPAQGTLFIFQEGTPANRRVRIWFLGAPSECYQLQSTGNFNGWSPVDTFNSPNGLYERVIALGLNPAPRNFRVERKLSFTSP